MWGQVWERNVMGSLTALKVKQLTGKGRYQDGDGLFLYVKASGARSWIVRLQADGKRRDYGLGSAKDVTLAEAREKAATIRRDLRNGIDPVEAKRKARLDRMTIPTFKEAATKKHLEIGGSFKTPRQGKRWLASMEQYAFPKLGGERIDHISETMIRDALLPIWLEKPETARRMRQRIETVMAWAKVHKFCGQLHIDAKSLQLPPQPPRGKHHPAMAYTDVPDFVAKVSCAPETTGRMALLFAIFTAARSGEARGATWEEIDIDAALWTIPAARMKMARDHIVPLSSASLTVLKRAAIFRTGRENERVFPSARGGTLSDMTLTKILRDMGIGGEAATVHGFRGSFKNWASEATGYPDAASEAALAHGDPDKVRGAYRTTDFLQLRVEMMAAWGAYCANDSTAGANVTPIRGVAA